MSNKECSACEKPFISFGGAIYCDSCRWDLHYSRNWYCRDYTKEEWMEEQRRLRVEKYRGKPYKYVGKWSVKG